jgi:hypothetical protein
MVEAYAMPRRMIQLTNKVNDFPFTPRAPAEISACENAIQSLHQDVFLFRIHYNGTEIQLGGAGLRALEYASTICGHMLQYGHYLRQALEALRDSMVKVKPMPSCCLPARVTQRRFSQR